MTVERLLAALALAVCLALLLRMAIGRGRRQRVDAAARRAWSGSQRGLRRALRRHPSRREPPHPAGDAAAIADAAIRRARRASTRDGNVIRPKAFHGPRKPH